MEFTLSLNQSAEFMQKSLKTKALSFTLGLSILFVQSSCVKKNVGPGGTSGITGTVTGQNFEQGKNEIQHITFTSGSQLEHGDYFLLNDLTSGVNFYIYFSNPNWISPANPNLEGRTGLEVVFNYSDSNVDIAQAVKSRLESVGVLSANLSLQQDILTLSWKSRKNVVDPDNGTTNFAVDVSTQGEADFLQTGVINMAEKRVYLCYGENSYASQDVRTNQLGEFIFTDLQKGTYKVYVISMSPPYEEMHKEVGKTVVISENKSIVDAGVLGTFF
ncbi:MAG: hypothetical protein RL207_681 [Bacteroidota bacterium]|jgi:hypothetical protein